jgi:SAM-dependent methyltransferase
MKKYFQKLYYNASCQNYKNITDLLENNYNANYLDVGCDDGDISMKFAKAINTRNIYGIEIIKKRAMLAEKHGIKTAVSDLDKKWPFEDNYFHVITGNQIIEHVSDIDHFASEIYRVLKPNGYAIISTENASSWHNIFASIMGWQIFSLTALSKIRPGIGNPMALHQNEGFGLGWTHKVIFNYRGLKEFLEIHGFKVEEYLGAGYYPLPFLSKFDIRHSHFITIKIRK